MESISCIDDEKLGMLMCAHFPRVFVGDIGSLSCDVCEDKIQGNCNGHGFKGDEVLDCMVNKVAQTLVNVESDFVSIFEH